MNQQGKKPKPSSSDYLKYSGMGLQMAAIIFLGIFGGRKLDSYFENRIPVFTLILSLSSVILAIYISIKDFIKPRKK